MAIIDINGIPGLIDQFDQQRKDELKSTIGGLSVLLKSFEAEQQRLTLKYGAGDPMVTDITARIEEIKTLLPALDAEIT